MKIVKIIQKWLLEIIFCLFIFLFVIFNDYFEKMFCLKDKLFKDTIFTLMPLVMTILSITLSMPKALIYGVEAATFRKLRKDKTYDYLSMLIITIVIFVLFTISYYLSFRAVILMLYIIAVIYSIIFINQEIPILMQNNKRIKKIIKNSVHKNGKEISYTELLNDVTMRNVLQNLLLTEGIISAYTLLKTKDEKRNRIYFEKILDMQNDYLSNCVVNHIDNYALLGNKYKNIEISQAIDMCFRNINDIIEMKQDFNILEIYADDLKDEGEEAKETYPIAKSLLALHEILLRLKLDRKLKKEFAIIMEKIFFKLKFENIGKKAEKFLYNILNTIVKRTLSDNKIWFIELLRDYIFLGLYPPYEYVIFLSLYLYYLVKLENRVPQDFKNKILDFINQKFNDNESWASVFNHTLRYHDFNKMTDLLTILLEIYECNESKYIWYDSGQFSSFSITFTKELIIDWWIGYVLTNSRISITEDELSNLKQSDAYLLSKVLNKNWFEEYKFIYGKSLPVFEFYGNRLILEDYVVNSESVKELKEFREKDIKESSKKGKKLPDKELEQYKDSLIEGFNKTIEELNVKNSIDLSEEPKHYIRISFDARDIDKLIKRFNEKTLRETILKLIYDDFSNNLSKHKKYISEFNEEILQEILHFNPTSKHAYIYTQTKDIETMEMVKKIVQIPDIKLWIPYHVFLKNEAITAHFTCIDEDFDVRYLTNEEINLTIDKYYKLVDGLYKYTEGENTGRTILLHKEELTEILSKKYIIAFIVFKYKIEYRVQDILYYSKRKK
ncbi:MAG TPA: hypothetical protein GX708_04760 [Gallicola sp.]|nr:hypothetical protein [Gallicola sp.]